MAKKKRSPLKITTITYGRTIQTALGENCKVEMTAEIPRSMTPESATNRLEILVKNELDKRFRRFR